MKTDRTRVEAQNTSSSRRRRHDIAPVPSPPRGHRVYTSREVEHRSHKRPRSTSPPRTRGASPPRTRGTSPPRTRGTSPPRTRGTSPPRTRGPKNGAQDGDGHQGGNDENDTIKRGREGVKAKKAKRRGSEDRETRREKKSKKERHSRKQLKKKHKQHRRGEENRVGSSKNGEWASEERRRSSSRSSSNSRGSDRGKEDIETPPRSKEEPIGTSGREETKGNGGCESSSVLGEDVPVPPAADPAVKPQGRDSRIEQEAVDLDEDAPTPPASPGVRPQEAEISAASAVDRSSFFAKLHALEGKKGTVGTVHASGVRGGGAGGGAEPLIKSSDWECLKCGRSNFKNASSCGRCQALKRMTLWRD